MTNPTTFERIQAPAAPAAPEPHTPGPFMRHGVMVRDTVETTGGMFCIRQARAVTTNGGRAAVMPGDVLAYAYNRADADLMAASAAMLAALRAYRGQYLDDRGTWPDDEAETLALADAAIAAAEGRA